MLGPFKIEVSGEFPRVFDARRSGPDAVVGEFIDADTAVKVCVAMNQGYRDADGPGGVYFSGPLCSYYLKGAQAYIAEKGAKVKRLTKWE